MSKVIPEMDSKTLDIVAENVNKLKELFPEAFTEGKVDFDALKEVLGEYVDGRDERYSFTWNGKSKARMLAQTPSTGTLRPCKEESADWNTTQNLFIEGDNLEVLKLLQKSYHKKIKIIYIDPPYNTGNDFIYKDNFKDNINNYKEITGQIDSEGRNFSNNPETSGRYHTDWLNMMYPRLKLARNLLSDAGVIFISIDDNEVSNLRKVCDEIYGEENFVGLIALENNPKGRKNSRFVSVCSESLMIFAKDKANVDAGFVENIPKDPDSIHTDQNGKSYTPGKRVIVGESTNPIVSEKVSRKHYSVYWHPESHDLVLESEDNIEDKNICLISSGYKRYISFRDGFFIQNTYTLEEFRRLHESNSLIYKDKNIYEKDFNFNVRVKSLIVNDNKKGIDVKTETAKKAIDKDLRDLFDNPKNIGLLKLLLTLPKFQKGDIVLDFFAGSATTAHAVMQLNTEDYGNRKFIMVQLPEVIDEKSEAFKAGYKTIAGISKERIKRAAAKLKEQNTKYQGDLGFKVFKLDSTNIKPWELNFEFTEQDLEHQISNIKPGREQEDVLYEVLLKYGLDLTLPITEHCIAGHKVFDIGKGALMICLSDDISLEVVEGIAKLKDELAPEIMRVVFKDAGFADDVVKTNAVQILKQAGIQDVRSL
ncbi:site-specific DNA-methyltransferase [Halomonas sediminis]